MNDDLEPEMDLAEQIFVLLREQPDGCSEYQLIQQLKARHSTRIPNLPLLDKLVLFRTHFLVFNALYQRATNSGARAATTSRFRR